MENILNKQMMSLSALTPAARSDISAPRSDIKQEMQDVADGFENLAQAVQNSALGQQGGLVKSITTLSKTISDTLSDNLLELSKEIREQTRSLSSVIKLAENIGAPATPQGGGFSLASLKDEFLDATNFFGINDKRIAERKFIQEQRALGATESDSDLKTSFEGAFQAGTDIKRAEADIARLREATGGKYSDEELMRSSEQNAKLFQTLNEAVARYATFDRGASLKEEALLSRAKVGAVEPVASAASAQTLSPAILAAGSQFQNIMAPKESGLSEAILNVGEQFKAIMDAKGDAVLNDSFNVSEEEAEALRMTEEQTEILRRIEAGLNGRTTVVDQRTAPAEERAVPQPSGGGGGSILGSALDLAKFIPGPIGLAASVISAVIPGRAIGGPISEGKPYMVGERGPEVVVPQEKGMVIPNGQSKTIDLGNGVRKRVNPDGSYSITDGGGTKVYDTSGNLVEIQSPRFGGFQETFKSDGSAVRSFNQGAASLQQSTDAAGNVVGSSARYQIADQVYQTSSNNKEAERMSAMGTAAPNQMVNNNTSINNTTNYVAPSPARNTESSYREYVKTKYAGQ